MEKDEKTKSKVVQTYAEDMAKVIESDKGGLVKKIIHGEEQHEQEKKNLSPESRKNRLFLLIGFLLTFSALATSYFFLFSRRAATVPVEQQFTPIIFNDQTSFFEISGFNKDQIVQTVLSEIAADKVKNGGIEGIYLTENSQIIGLRRFISLTQSHLVPGDNTFINDNFLMGVANNGFFILLKIRSAQDVFDSLRAWESSMLTDLHQFLGVNISSDTNYLFTKNFADGIVENKNARILYDKNNNPVLMYIFADDNSVIITASQAAAHQIVLELASAQVKQ